MKCTELKLQKSNQNLISHTSFPKLERLFLLEKAFTEFFLIFQRALPGNSKYVEPDTVPLHNDDDYDPWKVFWTHKANLKMQAISPKTKSCFPITKIGLRNEENFRKPIINHFKKKRP